MVAIFNQQCELLEKKVAIRTNIGGNCIQNPSDLDATYDGHKGAGYQMQISETCSNENQVQLITSVVPQTAFEQDSDAVETILDQLENAGFKPQEIQADTAYAGDENVQMAASRGVELVGPVAGRPQENDPEALTRIFHQLVFCIHIKEYLYVLCRFSPISLFLCRIPLTPS